jgi:hypothetical protein
VETGQRADFLKEKIVSSDHADPGEMAPTFSSAIADAHNYMDWIIGTMRPYLGRDVLEVGVGHGSYYE